jgi:hypothetical protein
MPKKRKFLEPGDTFGSWTVLRFSHLSGTADIYDCRCVCGNERKVRKTHMTGGRSTRCMSCNHADNRTHGMSKSPEYIIWRAMLARCHRKSAANYPLYGGRGIRVCSAWRGRGGFDAFVSHIGPRPSPAHSIDRIDNSGNYEPGNVRWTTPREQAQNRRSTRYLTIGGACHCVAEWSRRSGTNNQTIHERLKRGWADREAVFGRKVS